MVPVTNMRCAGAVSGVISGAFSCLMRCAISGAIFPYLAVCAISAVFFLLLHVWCCLPHLVVFPCLVRCATQPGPRPASSSATSKHRQNSRVPKNQIYFPVVSLEFANSLAGPPPPQKEGQLGAGSQRGAVRRTFLKMSKLAEASQNVGVDMPWGMKA